MFRERNEFREPSVAAVTDAFSEPAPVLTSVGATVAFTTGVSENADDPVTLRQSGDIQAGLFDHP